MIKRRKIHKVILLCIAAVMAAGTIVHAKTNENGSIKITLSDGEKGTEKGGVVFEYAKIADVVDGEYKEIEEYAKGIDFNKIKKAKQLEEAAAKMKTYVRTPAGSVITDENGITQIQNLETGLYLIYVAEQAKYETILPFFVSIPTWNEREGEMEFQVKVIPKHESVSKKSPIAPQTNLDSDYKKMFALSVGCILLALTVLCTNNRKKIEE